MSGLTFGQQAAVASAPAAVGGIFGFIGAKKRAKRQHRYNKELAEYTFQKNMEAWQMQNEYNHPAEQMKRLKQAGLNPNLMYGQGQQTSAGESREFPKYHQEGLEVANPVEALQMAMLGAQIRKTEAETKNIDAGTGETKARTGKIGFEISNINVTNS